MNKNLVKEKSLQILNSFNDEKIPPLEAFNIAVTLAFFLAYHPESQEIFAGIMSSFNKQVKSNYENFKNTRPADEETNA